MKGENEINVPVAEEGLAKKHEKVKNKSSLFKKKPKSNASKSLKRVKIDQDELNQEENGSNAVNVDIIRRRNIGRQFFSLKERAVSQGETDNVNKRTRNLERFRIKTEITSPEAELGVSTPEEDQNNNEVNASVNQVSNMTAGTQNIISLVDDTPSYTNPQRRVTSYFPADDDLDEDKETGVYVEDEPLDLENIDQKHGLGLQIDEALYDTAIHLDSEKLESDAGSSVDPMHQKVREPITLDNFIRTLTESIRELEEEEVDLSKEIKDLDDSLFEVTKRKNALLSSLEEC